MTVKSSTHDRAIGHSLSIYSEASTFSEPPSAARFWEQIVEATAGMDSEAAESLRIALWSELQSPGNWNFKEQASHLLRAGLLFSHRHTATLPPTGKGGILVCLGHRTPSTMRNLLPVAREAMRRDLLGGIVCGGDYSSDLQEFTDSVPVVSMYRLVGLLPRPERLRIVAESYRVWRAILHMLRLRMPSMASRYVRNAGEFFEQITISLLMKAAARRALEGWRPDCLVASSDFWPFEYQLARQAKELSIPSVVIQHGTLARHWWPFVADVYAMWGKFFLDSMVAWGTPAHRLAICGMPATDDLFSRGRQLCRRSPGTKPVCLILSHTHTRDRNDESKMFAAYGTLLRELVSSTPSVVWKVKLHPAEDQSFYEKWGLSRMPNLQIWPSSTTLEETISDADVVTTLYSTAGLEAMVMERPVLITNIASKAEEIAWWPALGGGSYAATAAEFKTQLWHLLSDGNNFDREVMRQKQFLSKQFANPGHAAEAVVDLLDRVCDAGISRTPCTKPIVLP